MMKFAFWGSFALAVATMVSSAVAGDTFSMYCIGNSITADLDSMFPAFGGIYAAANNTTFTWGGHFRNGTDLNFFYKNPTDPATSGSGTRSSVNLPSTVYGIRYGQKGVPDWNVAPWTVALPAHHWNVVTMEPWAMSGGGDTLATDTRDINAIIATTLTNPQNVAGAANPTRFYIYTPWNGVINDMAPITPAHPSNANTKSLKDFAVKTPDSPGEPTTLTHSYYNDLLTSVRVTHPDIWLIPEGDVFNALIPKMMNNEFDNFTSIDQIHRDGTHSNSVGQNIVSWTAYAVIFKQSPVGLPVQYRGNGCAARFANGPVIDSSGHALIDDHDRLLFQQTIWDLVKAESNYTGVRTSDVQQSPAGR